MAERYRERSPLYHAERLSKPVIFFQGEEDEVVPPNQSEAMVEVLRRKGRAVGYFLFSGEQHGSARPTPSSAARRGARVLRHRGVQDRAEVLGHRHIDALHDLPLPCAGHIAA